MALTLDYPYNRNLAKKLSNHGYTHWEPYMTSQIRGGQMYAMPGSSASYPMFNSVEQNSIDRGKRTKKQVLSGKARSGGSDQSKVENQVIRAIEGVVDKDQMSGGAFKFDKKKVGDVVKVVAKTALSKGLDIGIPALGATVSTYFGGNPAIGIFVGKIVRGVLKAKTGYARDSDIGTYKGGGCKKPLKKVPRKGGKCPSKAGPAKKRGERNEIVKRVMREKNMNLPTASKYVKEHGLY
jgi:hypothetical protein